MGRVKAAATPPAGPELPELLNAAVDLGKAAKSVRAVAGFLTGLSILLLIVGVLAVVTSDKGVMMPLFLFLYAAVSLLLFAVGLYLVAMMMRTMSLTALAVRLAVDRRPAAAPAPHAGERSAPPATSTPPIPPAAVASPQGISRK